MKEKKEEKKEEILSIKEQLMQLEQEQIARNAKLEQERIAAKKRLAKEENRLKALQEKSQKIMLEVILKAFGFLMEDKEYIIAFESKVEDEKFLKKMREMVIKEMGMEEYEKELRAKKEKEKLEEESTEEEE